MKARKKLIYLWLLAPIILLTIHYQWGVGRIETEKALSVAKTALQLEIRARESWTPEDWALAQEKYREAIENLPEEENLLRTQLELASARTQMYQGDLVKAMTSLKHLLERAEADNLDKGLRDEIRETLARSQYGLAWVMRKKHVNNQVWDNIAHAARQNFRYLAETSNDAKSTAVYAKNLESVVNLANSARSPRKRIDQTQNAADAPKEAVNSKEGSLAKKAKNPDSETAPSEAKNADGEAAPSEAKNADGEAAPSEAKNADGEAAPSEAANAEGEAPPMEAKNADASAEEMMAELMAAEGGEPGAGPPGSGISQAPADARGSFSNGANAGKAPGGGS